MLQNGSKFTIFVSWNSKIKIRYHQCWVIWVSQDRLLLNKQGLYIYYFQSPCRQSCIVYQECIHFFIKYIHSLYKKCIWLFLLMWIYNFIIISNTKLRLNFTIFVMKNLSRQGTLILIESKEQIELQAFFSGYWI